MMATGELKSSQLDALALDLHLVGRLPVRFLGWAAHQCGTANPQPAASATPSTTPSTTPETNQKWRNSNSVQWGVPLFDGLSFMPCLLLALSLARPADLTAWVMQPVATAPLFLCAMHRVHRASLSALGRLAPQALVARPKKPQPPTPNGGRMGITSPHSRRRKLGGGSTTEKSARPKTYEIR